MESAAQEMAARSILELIFGTNPQKGWWVMEVSEDALME
jgi:hypothetical protein